MRAGLVTGAASARFDPRGDHATCSLCSKATIPSPGLAVPAGRFCSASPWPTPGCALRSNGRKSGRRASPICAAKPPAWRNPISAPRPTTGFTRRNGRNFFQVAGGKGRRPGEPVGIRHDAAGTCRNRTGAGDQFAGPIVGHTIGNDMSSRDIEGENLLYLPQAKIYDRSCALGPWIGSAYRSRRPENGRSKLGSSGPESRFHQRDLRGQNKRGLRNWPVTFLSQVFPAAPSC